eukprot:1187977-Prorocentrum_minimum.AAC.5
MEGLLAGRGVPREPQLPIGETRPPAREGRVIFFYWYGSGPGPPPSGGGAHVVCGDVRGVVAVEAAPRGARVRAHVVEHQPLPEGQLRQGYAARDGVQAVARRAVERAPVIIRLRARLEERPRRHRRVVVQDAVERPVQAVRQPVLVRVRRLQVRHGCGRRLLGEHHRRNLPHALGHHRRAQRAYGLGKVPPRLGDDAHLLRGKVQLERVGDGAGDARDGHAAVRRHAREAASDVQQLHRREAEGGSDVEGAARGGDGAAERLRVGGAAAHVERDALHVQAEALGRAEEGLHLVGERAVLGAERAARGGVVRLDAQHAPRLRPVLLELAQLELAVEGGGEHAGVAREPDVARGLGGVGVDDAVGGHAVRLHRRELRGAGDVEAGAAGDERGQQPHVAHALHRVEGLHAGEQAAPVGQLALHHAEVDHVEGLVVGASGRLPAAEVVKGRLAGGNGDHPAVWAEAEGV